MTGGPVPAGPPAFPFFSVIGMDSLKPETLLAQAPGHPAAPYGEIVPPIHVATTYERGTDLGYPGGRVYGRDGNPSFTAAEGLLTQLEGGAASMLFASGMAAATAVFQALDPGDRVVVPRVMYWALRHWLVTEGERRGLKVTLFDNLAADPVAALAEATGTRPVKLVWLETPANPTWDVIDIAAAAKVAHAAGALLAVDSTVATPILCRPLALGADLVMHAATKYLNGHSDVLAGTLTTARDDDFWARLKVQRALGGGIMGPFEAWLLLRGMRTLSLRVGRASTTAMAIARHFQSDPRVAVLYPGLPSFPGHEVAARQMVGGFSGMMSLRINGGRDRALRMHGRLKLFRRATSLGGVESLVEHRASIEGPTSPCPDDLLRMSIGLEDAGDLIADLEQALA